MLIQKSFHLHMLKEEAQSRLANLAGYRRQFANVEIAVVSPEGGEAHFVFRLPWGFRGDVRLVQVPSENPAQMLFRSSHGNIKVLGVLELFEIRRNLTEVILTLDYNIVPPFSRIIDRLGRGLDHFLNRQLQQVEAYFAQSPEGMRADTKLSKPINHHPQ